MTNHDVFYIRMTNHDVLHIRMINHDDLYIRMTNHNVFYIRMTNHTSVYINLTNESSLYIKVTYHDKSQSANRHCVLYIVEVLVDGIAYEPETITKCQVGEPVLVQATIVNNSGERENQRFES